MFQTVHMKIKDVTFAVLMDRQSDIKTRTGREKKYEMGLRMRIRKKRFPLNFN